MSELFDVLVLGAGANELVAATLLARAGRKVLVIESRESVGGVLATEAIAPGFHVDACAHNVGWLDPRVVQDLGLASHGLEILGIESSLLVPDPDGQLLELSANVERAAQSISALSSHDAEAWPRFVERLARLAGFLATLYRHPAPLPTSRNPRDIMALLGLGRRFRRLGKVEMFECLRTLPLSAADFLDDWFESDLLKGALAQAAVAHLDQGPRSAGTAFVLLHQAAGQPKGALRSRTVIRGGVGSLPKALAGAFEAAGGTLRLGTPIESILARANRVTGVLLADGQDIAAATVLSGADPRRTFLQHLDPTLLDPEFVHTVRNVKLNGVAAKVNLALGELPRFRQAAQHDAGLLRGTIALCPTVDSLERAYDDSKYGRVSARPSLEIMIPSVLDPSLAPEGRHVMSVWVQYVPYRLRQGRWDQAARDALGEQVIDLIAEHAPNVPEAIIERQVLSPADLESAFGVTEGHVLQGHLTLDQILFMRPLPGWARYRTPIHGLYLVGPATHPALLAGQSGALAAREVLRDQSRKKTPAMRG